MAFIAAISGFFVRLFYILSSVYLIAKWCIIETFTKHKDLDFKDVTDRSNDIAVITGGTRGIGFEVVNILMKVNMTVIMGCRSIEDGNSVLQKIRNNGVSTGSLLPLELDLTSLDSVRKFADSVQQIYPAIHILVNNAGTMPTSFTSTKDGFESQFQVNYLAHFLLTQNLYPALALGGRWDKFSRIINVSSIMHYYGTVNFNDLQHEKVYSPLSAYMQSKFMQIASTIDINARLANNHNYIRALSVHPGVNSSGVQDELWYFRIASFILRPFFKTAEQGAHGVAYAALSAQLEGIGGIFLANCKAETPNMKCADKSTQLKLFNLSCELAGI